MKLLNIILIAGFMLNACMRQEELKTQQSPQREEQSGTSDPTSADSSTLQKDPVQDQFIPVTPTLHGLVINLGGQNVTVNWDGTKDQIPNIQ